MQTDDCRRTQLLNRRAPNRVIRSPDPWLIMRLVGASHHCLGAVLPHKRINLVRRPGPLPSSALLRLSSGSRRPSRLLGKAQIRRYVVAGHIGQRQQGKRARSFTEWSELRPRRVKPRENRDHSRASSVSGPCRRILPVDPAAGSCKCECLDPTKDR